MKRMFTMACLAVFGASLFAGCKADVAVDPDGKAATSLQLPR
jgi:hypothetical protein